MVSDCYTSMREISGKKNLKSSFIILYSKFDSAKMFSLKRDVFIRCVY